MENLRTRVFVKKVHVKSKASFEGKESAKQAFLKNLYLPALPSRNKINNTSVTAPPGTTRQDFRDQKILET